MVGLFGLTSRRANRAMKTSYEDTDRKFRIGAKRHKAGESLSAAQKVFCRRLKSLAPRPRRKRLLQGPF